MAESPGVEIAPPAARSFAGEPGRRFEELFRATQQRVRDHIRARCAESSHVRLVFDEVYLEAWRRIDEVPAGAAAEAWLLRASDARLNDGLGGSASRP